MTPATTTDSRSRNLILTAMIFAVSMTFIDETIVSIAVPHIPASCAWTSLTPRRPYAWSWPASWPPPHSSPSPDCVKDDSKNQASPRSHPNREHREKRSGPDRD
jgi:hypothetical protein